EALDVLAKEHGGLVVELMEHQARLVLDDVDVSVEAQHRPRGLEPEETAADDDRRAARDLPREQTVRVGHAAKHMDAGQLDARDRRHARPRAGREHETLIAVHLARRVVHEPRATIDPDDAASRQHGYVSSERKPPVRVERAGRQLAREQRRESHAVVRAARLVPENEDREALVETRKVLGERDAGGTSADYDAVCASRGFPSARTALSHAASTLKVCRSPGTACRRQKKEAAEAIPSRKRLRRLCQRSASGPAMLERARLCPARCTRLQTACQPGGES